MKLPSDFKINTIYPNPFNPETEISYTLTHDGETELLVYDVLGREVGILVKEFKNAGSYSVHLNARNMPSGAYILILHQGGSSTVQKAMLMK